MELRETVVQPWSSTHLELLKLLGLLRLLTLLGLSLKLIKRVKRVKRSNRPACLKHRCKTFVKA